MRHRLLFASSSSDNLQDLHDRPHDGRGQFSTPAILCGVFCQAASHGNQKHGRYLGRYFPCGAACEQYKQKQIRVVGHGAQNEAAYWVWLLVLNFPRRFMI